MGIPLLELEELLLELDELLELDKLLELEKLLKLKELLLELEEMLELEELSSEPDEPPQAAKAVDSNKGTARPPQGSLLL